MKKRDPPETSVTTSSYETALTTMSKNRDAKTPAKDDAQDTTRGSLPPVASAPVADSTPEWLELPDTEQAAECKPAVKVPSDQWLPRRLSQLGIPYIPRQGDKSKVKRAYGNYGEEPVTEHSVDQTGSSRSSDTRVRRTPSEKIAGPREGSSSASMVKERGEAGATSGRTRAYERDEARSEAKGRSPRGIESSVQTTLQTLATSPFSVHSATSDERRPHEDDSATEHKDELKVEPAIQRRQAASSYAPPTPTRSMDQRTFKLDNRGDEPKAKRSFCGRLVFAGVVAVSVLLLALMSFALMEYMRNRGLPVVKGLFGAVRGQRLVVSDQGREWTVLAFLGVPFAKVPRGPLRFKPPQPLDSPLGVTMPYPAAACARLLETPTAA